MMAYCVFCKQPICLSVADVLNYYCSDVESSAALGQARTVFLLGDALACWYITGHFSNYASQQGSRIAGMRWTNKRGTNSGRRR